MRISRPSSDDGSGATKAAWPRRFQFFHDLSRAAAYKALLGSNRKILHNTAAEILLAARLPGSIGDKQLVSELWQHLKAAGRYVEAHRWCLEYCNPLQDEQGSLKPDRRYDESQALWNEARNSDASLPLRSPHLLMYEARRLGVQKRYDEESALQAEAFELALQMDELLYASQILLMRATSAMFPSNNIERAAEFIAQADRICQDALASDWELLELQLMCLNYQGALHAWRSDYEAALPYFQTVEKKASGLVARECNALINQGLALSHLQRLSSALATYERALEKARQVASLGMQLVCLRQMSLLHLEAGESAVARPLMDEACSLAFLTGDYFEVHTCGAFRGYVRICQGEALEGLAELDQAVAYLQPAAGDPDWDPALRIWQGLGLARLGRIEEAQTCLHEVTTFLQGADIGLATAAVQTDAFSDAHLAQLREEVQLRHAA